MNYASDKFLVTWMLMKVLNEKNHSMKLVIHIIVIAMENNMKAGRKLLKMLTSW